MRGRGQGKAWFGGLAEVGCESVHDSSDVDGMRMRAISILSVVSASRREPGAAHRAGETGDQLLMPRSLVSRESRLLGGVWRHTVVFRVVG